MDPKPPTPIETLSLWGLAAKGGSDWLDCLRPALRARKNLLALGLIIEKKESRTAGKRSVKATKISLADPGWQWLEQHAGEAIAARSPAGTEVLGNLLKVLSHYLQARELPLKELWQAPPAKPGPTNTESLSATPALTGPELRHEMLQSVRRLADSSGRVRLADLRAALRATLPAEFYSALLSLQKHGKLVLYPLDNPEEITPADRQAALDIAGYAVHVAYLV